MKTDDLKSISENLIDTFNIAGKDPSTCKLAGLK